MSDFRVLVTGSRDWTDATRIGDAVAAVAYGIPDGVTLVVVHGACPSGADRMAAAWVAPLLGDGCMDVEHVREERHPADWGTYGKAAGFRRNAEMVALGAEVCLAFVKANSRGASHCAALAERAGITTHYFREP